MEERRNYWRRQRVSRRAVLRGAAIGGAGLAGAALVGCGGGDDEATPAATAAAATAAPAATAAATAAAATGPKPGGTYRVSSTGDPPTLDPYGSGSAWTKGVAAYAYSRLFKVDVAPDTNPYDRPLIPDAASGYEAPDGQVWIVKLRPGVKFHNLAPVNGRELVAGDVMYSWQRLTAPDSVNASAVEQVVKAEAVDDQTLRFELAAPSPIFLENLADGNNLWIMPTEAESGFQATITPIGTGPWVMKSYQASSRFQFAKHPDYYEMGMPYLDAIDNAIIPEYANARAQFEAGNLDVLGVIADDVVDLKKQHDDWQWVGEVNGGVAYLFFGPPDKDPDAPWRDERYRQGASMAIDRNAIMELSYNVAALKGAGLNPSEAWNNIVSVTLGQWWLDPQSAAQGPSAKFFQYDPAEARKLFEAAGGLDTPVKWQYSPTRYGVSFDRTAEAIGNWFAEAGLNVTTDLQDYTSTYFPQTRAGNFNGIAMGITPAYPEVSGFVDRYFSDASSNAGKVDDPAIKELRAKQAIEFDQEARLQQVHDIQRRNAEMMFYLPTPLGAGTAWTAYLPRVQGIVRTRGYGGPTEVYSRLWLES